MSSDRSRPLHGEKPSCRFLIAALLCHSNGFFVGLFPFHTLLELDACTLISSVAPWYPLRYLGPMSGGWRPCASGKRFLINISSTRVRSLRCAMHDARVLSLRVKFINIPSMDLGSGAVVAGRGA